MGRWLSLAYAEADEKIAETPVCGTDETDKTHVRGVSSVLSVRQMSISEKISRPAEAASGGFVSFVSSPKGAFSENFVARAPSPEPAVRLVVEEPESPEAAVARRLDAMARENADRHDWWRASPYEPSGSLVIRSAMTGEEITIHLPRGRTRH
ncbi:hypothetical protein [Methylosinus sp. PW1]|uniref:hypothetical protein n=1 Tax=Methylosinus sp. PW1 TaxID=107636 RepID=UPI0012EC85EB|nr:hypothetical protein [Methylosinus sp. PW1]